MFPAENLRKLIIQVVSLRIMIRVNASVQYRTWSNHSILFLNGTSALFIRRAIESKIHQCTLLNLSPSFSFITLILAVPSAAGGFANSRIATLGESCWRKCSITIMHN